MLGKITVMKGLFLDGVLTSDTAITHDMKWAPQPLSVWVNPVAGDTITVSYSLDNGATYTAWSLGAITSASTDKSLVFYSGITHLRFQRTAGTGVTSTYGVC